MPVKADVLDGRVVALRELALHVAQQDPHDERHADHDVETVDAGHHEVDREEDAGVSGFESFSAEESTGQEAIVELVAVLEVFDDEEAGGTSERDGQEGGGLLRFVLLCGTNGEGHREARTDQDERVDAAHDAIEMMMCLDKRIEVLASEDRERAEETSEEQDFRHEEEPHAHTTSVELGRGFIEVVGDVELRREFRRIHGFHSVRIGAHQWVSWPGRS